MRRLIPALFLLSVVMSSCHFFHGREVHGNGTVIKQDRGITGFVNVDVSSSLDVFVKQDSVFSVKVETDSNLQEFIEVYKQGETLYIHISNNTDLSPSEKVKVYVSAPQYKELRASGACSINKNGRINADGIIQVEISGASDADLDIKAPEVKIGLTGASSATISGETKDFVADGSGSSHFKCFGLLAENTKVELSGAGNAEVYASVKLDVNASGAAHVSYKGNATVNSNTSGAAGVVKAEQ